MTKIGDTGVGAGGECMVENAVQSFMEKRQEGPTYEFTRAPESAVPKCNHVHKR